MTRASQRRRVHRYTADGDGSGRADTLAGEEPLEIRLDGRPFTVTMRTPGHDFDLVAGFLVSEGVVRAPAEIEPMLATLGLMHVFVPEWRLSPYFTLGTGVIYTEPKSTLVQAEDRDDQIGYVGGGLQFYLTRRFMLRFAEYRHNIIFTSRNDNEEVDEWKYVGFAFFF